MAIFDEIKSTFSSGVEAAGRGTRNLQLKNQLSALEKERGQLMAQLGASLYEEVRSNEAIRATRGGLFNSIEQVDVQRAAIAAEIESLAQQSQHAAAAHTVFPCPQCHRNVSMTDKFCVGCGLNVQEYLQSQQAAPFIQPTSSAQPVQSVSAAPVVPVAQPVSVAPADPVAPVAPVAPAPVELAVPVCSNCGLPLEEDAKFCVGCGTSVAPA